MEHAATPYPHAHWVLLALVPAIGVAFWPGYFARLGEAPLAHHVHGLTGSAWNLLLVLQSWAIHHRRFTLHRAAGRSSLPLFLVGGLMALHAMATGFAAQAHPFVVLFGARRPRRRYTPPAIQAGERRMSFELVTERLRIRPWRPADRPALERMVRDPDMMRYITHGRTWADEEVDELLERQARHLENHGVCFGAVELRATGEVIGLVGLQPHDDGQFELGWWIWKEHWGRGYATEAARACVAHARDVMGLDRLVAVIDPPNAASIRVAEHLGMKFEDFRSAADTIARREDIPIAYYGLDLRGWRR